ncbi:MAG TPA: WYL domain-containing transcriptional regulator [Dehalococcoidia bacterium]|nr:WYL domain-containing transcriptional regulator [Dehalococcoidia bacterium]
MRRGGKEYDRLARLQRLIYILNQNPGGIGPEELARQCGVTVRQIYRDRKALEDQLNVPVWAGRGKWGIEPGLYLPPISFTTPEAMTVFLASRLLLAYSNAYNPSIVSTLTKLNSVVPGPLRDQIRKTIEWMEKQRRDAVFVHTLETLARAWIEGRRVKILYWALDDRIPKERIIEPYFIQPAAWEHANYVIAHCSLADAIRVFKVERIERIQLLDEHYSIPAEFDANEYLSPAWGITVRDEIETVKLKFAPELAMIAEETIWHPSQVTKLQPDGSALVTMRLAINIQLQAFILGWGEKVEVLEPESLRKDIVHTARRMLEMYRAK